MTLSIPTLSLHAAQPAQKRQNIANVKEPSIGPFADLFSPQVRKALMGNTDFAVIVGPENQTYLILPDSATFGAQTAQANRLRVTA